MEITRSFTLILPLYKKITVKIGGKFYLKNCKKYNFIYYERKLKIIRGTGAENLPIGIGF